MPMTQRLSLLTRILILCLCAGLLAGCAPKRSPFQLTIVHTNDSRGYVDPCG